MSQEKFQFLLIFSLIFCRYLFFGWEYFYQLDDYAQHHNYLFIMKEKGNSIPDFFQETGFHSMRPLATLLDITLWSWLFEEMIFGVLLISLLYAGSAMLFYKLFSQFFPCSPLFLVIYSLIPLGFEGVYWMSASSRVVTGIFLASLSAYFFQEFCTKGKKSHFLIFFLGQTLSFGLYEQCMVLSLTLTGLLILYHLIFSRDTQRKRSLLGFSFLFSLYIYYFVTHLGEAAEMYANRSEIILPSPYYYEVFLPELLSQMKTAFLAGGFYTLFKGFLRGWEILIAQQGYLYLIFTLLAVGFLGFFPKNSPLYPETSQKKELFKRISGSFIAIILLFAPISIFFFIATPWFGLRNTVASFCGIALLIDLVLGLFWQFLPKGQQLKQVLILSLAFACMIASISELSDYRDTYYDDYQVVSTIYPYVSTLDPSFSVAVLGIEKTYLEDMNLVHHEHLHGVTESDWALAGRMYEYSKVRTAYITPLPVTTNTYFPYNAAHKRPDNFDFLFYYDHKTAVVTPLTVEVVVPEGEYVFYDETGQVFARLFEEENRGTTTLEP